MVNPMIKSHWRGNEMYFKNDTWFYSSDNTPVPSDKDRACGHCGKSQTIEGHDGCLGTIEGVMNACCGHGVDNLAYIQLLDGNIISGKYDVNKWICEEGL